MCNPNLILSLLAAGEGFYGLAMGFLIGAIIANGSIFGAASAPGLVRAAAAFLAIAAGSLGAAVSQLGNCTSGPCGRFASGVMGFAAALVFSMTALAAALVFLTIPAAIPLVGATLLKVLLIAFMVATGTAWFGTFISFLLFYTCATTSFPGAIPSGSATSILGAGALVTTLLLGLAALAAALIALAG